MCFQSQYKDKDRLLTLRNLLWDILRLPSSRRAALGLYVILTLWRGRGVNQPPYALLLRSSLCYALGHGRRHILYTYYVYCMSARIWLGTLLFIRSTKHIKFCQRQLIIFDLVIIIFRLVILKFLLCFRRATLFRMDVSVKPPEWKELGIGNVKILQHENTGTCRVLMQKGWNTQDLR